LGDQFEIHRRFFKALGQSTNRYSDDRELLFLAQALKTIPLGTGYAVWTGIGASGTAILGIILFAESAALPRLACIGMILAGIIGLKLVSN
jgi:multidrug transporter EmrE-like cation transporter